jgi:hypothetical protein
MSTSKILEIKKGKNIEGIVFNVIRKFLVALISIIYQEENKYTFSLFHIKNSNTQPIQKSCSKDCFRRGLMCFAKIT